MNIHERIECLCQLGKQLAIIDYEDIMAEAQLENPWFTQENQRFTLDIWMHEYLTEGTLLEWLSSYTLSERPSPKTVGLVLAGNIPLVGFHDIISTFLAGHISQIKLSDKDKILIPFMLKTLSNIDPRTKDYFKVVDRLKDYDAVIATGSNNSAIHFEHYFSKVPHIIRKNRNGIAILHGNETLEELSELAKDIFMFFGLGCRNVSKLYVPQGYSFTELLSVLETWDSLSFHNKYKNNLDYNLALFLLNRVNFIQHEVLLLVESPHIASRVGSLHYEYYTDTQTLAAKLTEKKDEIQCVVGHKVLLPDFEVYDFGKAQKPSINTYADGIDTLKFLTEL